MIQKSSWKNVYEFLNLRNYETYKIIFIVMILLFSLTSTADSESFYDINIRSDKFANWIVVDETISFKILDRKIPDSLAKIDVNLRDSDGTPVEHNVLNLNDFLSFGWKRKFLTPGFYSVTFSGISHAGEKYPAGTSKIVELPRWKEGNKSKLQPQKKFFFVNHGIAVLPSPTRAPSDISPQFGASICSPLRVDSEYHSHKMRVKARATALMGAHSVRLMSNSLWDRTEPALGHYHWKPLDKWFELMKKYGFSDFSLLLQGTAKWAAKKTDNSFRFIPKYQGMPPENFGLWSSYITALMARYPFVKKWEMWSEAGTEEQPSYCWYGTPQEFGALLKATYKTIKKNQPDSCCYLGAPHLGMYEYLLKHGYETYYDAISLHGKWPAIEKYRDIEKRFGIERKKWANLEWHAILTSAKEPKLPSEVELSRDMLINFTNQLRHGAEIVYFYGPLGSSGNMEILKFYKKHGFGWGHNFGLFNLTPYTTPRLPAVVWRNFTHLFSGRIHFIASYAFKKQNAALLESKSGRVLLIWHDSKKTKQLSSELLEAIGKETVISDWEGRVIAPAAYRLSPNKIIFMKRPKMSVLSKWSDKKAQVLQKRKPELRHKTRGHYSTKSIFDKNMQVLKPDALPWNKFRNSVSLVKKPVQKDYFAEYSLAMNSKGLDVMVKVKDSVYFPSISKMTPWKGDSVQIELDTFGNGLVEDRIEFIAYSGEKGPVLWKWAAPFDGNLPTGCSSVNSKVENSKILIYRKNGTTIYKIHVDSTELYPFHYYKNVPLRIALQVNNNDGNGYVAYLGWASGISYVKNPALYGDLTVMDTGKNCEQLSLNHVSGGAKFTRLDSSNIRIDSKAATLEGGAFLETEKKDVIEGASYEIKFKARGNVKLHGMLVLWRTGKENKRFDFMRPSPLSDTWNDFQHIIIMPRDTNEIKVSIFCWKQDGWFEIKDFEMNPI